VAHDVSGHLVTDAIDRIEGQARLLKRSSIRPAAMRHARSASTKHVVPATIIEPPIFVIWRQQRISARKVTFARA